MNLESPKESGLPVFDETAYETYFGGAKIKNSASIYVKCAETVLANMDSRFLHLEEAIVQGHKKNISDLAHQLKGGFRAIGGSLLGEVCFVIEKNAEQMSPQELRDQFSELKKIRPQFENQLKAFLVKMNATPTS